MSGELNGTNILLEVYDDGVPGVIAGQMEVTNTRTGTPIDISNKSYGDNVALLDGELASDGFSLSGNFMFNNHSSFILLRETEVAGGQINFILSSLATAHRWRFTAAISGVGDTFPHGAAVTTALTLTSSGAPIKL